jgi:hypothetical protein
MNRPAAQPGWQRGRVPLPAIALLAGLALLAALPYLFGTYWQQLGFRALQLLTRPWRESRKLRPGQVSRHRRPSSLGAYAFALSATPPARRCRCCCSLPAPSPRCSPS